MKVALIDADSIIHIVAYHNAVPSSMLEILSDDNPEIKEETIQEFYKAKNPKPVLDHVDSFISDIITKTESSHYLGFVGAREGSDTFRHKLAVTKPYKGQRGKTPHWTKYWKPIIIEHMVVNWGFIELANIEADDACAICATEFKEKDIDYIICSPDKDLKQISGNHYDYKKLEFDHVTHEQSMINLCTQVLVGDSTDNISGCPKVGAKSPLLKPLLNMQLEDMFEYIKNIFSSKGFGDMFQEQYDLVYMLRKLNGLDLTSIPIPLKFTPLGDNNLELNQETELPPIQESPTFNQ